MADTYFCDFFLDVFVGGGYAKYIHAMEIGLVRRGAGACTRTLIAP
jgi:hypothetical protein